MWALLAFLLVVAATGGFMVRRATAPSGGSQAAQGSSVGEVSRRNPADPFAVGAVDAPVVISEFSDFECPFCFRFANDTRPEIVSRYVDTGLVRIEWNDFPVNGENAEAAAKAGRAAAAQGKFEEFAQAYYKASAPISGHPHFVQSDFERFAQEAGVPDMEKFRRQSTDGTFDDAIEKAKAFGTSIGVSGTPGFLVGNQFISGAQPTEVFHRAIDAQLQKAAATEEGA
ncbi:DsbA family protein [Corynebacterium vitaeruminis]|uniref:DsbA family protein n=1 Tax=Corynebacterium vitaeruminis TaxID=38305 RepID=UPI000553138F